MISIKTKRRWCQKCKYVIFTQTACIVTQIQYQSGNEFQRTLLATIGGTCFPRFYRFVDEIKFQTLWGLGQLVSNYRLKVESKRGEDTLTMNI